MAEWLNFMGAGANEHRVFVQPRDIMAVKEKADSTSVLILTNGSEVPVTANALLVMSKISSPPAPPSFVAQHASPTDVNFAINGAGEAWATVVLKDGAQNIVTTTVDETGAWSVGAVLAPGTHDLSAVQTNIFGLASQPSATAVVTIEAPPPPEPVPEPIATPTPEPPVTSDTPTETPADAPADPAATPPYEEPAAPPADTPAETPAEPPAEEPAEEPAGVDPAAEPAADAHPAS